MHYSITQNAKDRECLVIGLLNDAPLPSFSKDLDYELIKVLAERLKEPGDSLWQSQMGAGSLLLIQCGKSDKFDATAFYKRIADISNALLKQHISNASIYLPDVAGRTPAWQAEHMLLGFDSHCYCFQELKSKKNPLSLQKIAFLISPTLQPSLDAAMAIAQGVSTARRLADLPANICTPSYLAEAALELQALSSQIKVQVLDTEAMQKLGMGALLAVSQGSIQAPKLIEIQYQGGDDRAPIVLIGKGITFDSGGISLKPPAGMEEMKFDMGGAASVLGTLKACALLKLPINVIGIMACAENMPSGMAIKPGDVVTSMSGQTIEIVNTDAEGRLVLADALTYAKRFKPQFVIDIATLTGAMIIALGHLNTGFMTADEPLAKALNDAAHDSHDKAWRLPLDAGYQDVLESPVADLVNSPADRAAGSITAACFLSRFAEDLRWAHLDIAGTAWVSGKNRQATGRPVPLLTTVLRHVAHTR